MFEQEFATPGEALLHYGIKGMKWGQRKSDGPAGVPSKTNKAAKADAEEHTRAKLFYGEGAGTRRKLIKAKVEQKSKDPHYKKAFDHHVGNTDLNKRATQATKERKRKDRTAAVKKTGKGVGHIARGNNQYANTAATIITAAAIAGHKSGVTAGAEKRVAETLSKTMKEATKARDRRTQKTNADWMRRQGYTS